jgi:LSD1 subclass zinc finger protein
MKLRIRCPSCRTVLNVPPGAEPVCPSCGFGAAGDAEPQWDPAGEPAQAGQEWQPAAEGAEWQPAEGTPEGWGEPAPAPKKRGLFGRKK